MTRVWMDQGGTFTDIVRVDDDGRVQVQKALSNSDALTETPAEGDSIRRGTTVATNALLERNGTPVLLLTNEGFADMPWVGDQVRPDLFSLHIKRPEPLCVGVVEVGGRINAQGRVIAPLSVDIGALMEWKERGTDSVAIVLIHGPLHPQTELQLKSICTDVGFSHISIGHEVAPSRGYLSRLHTTLADAALTPLLPTAPGLYMRSDGGLSQQKEWSGANAVLSGPAGGVVATAALARAAGPTPAFGLDMGGTSTDVCRVNGAPERTDHIDIAGLHLRVPSLQLETVAAGGGSLLGIQDGILTVGPRSAGAEPGPAAYGHGGPATLTDAEVALGRLPRFPKICGDHHNEPIDPDAARAAIAQVCPGMPIEEAAVGFKQIAAETAARAIRSLAASRGVDPAQHVLVAFGGAGPGHCCAVARALGIQTILVPRLAGVFSAVGIGHAVRRAETVAPVATSIADAVQHAKDRLPFSGNINVRLACRHDNTQHLMEIVLHDEIPDTSELSESLITQFHEVHQARFGFTRPSLSIRAVEVRIDVEEREENLIELGDEEDHHPPSSTRAWFDEWLDVPLLSMMDANGVSGPAILTGGGTTVVVEPGWQVEVKQGFLRLTDNDPPPSQVSTSFHPIHTAIFATRTMAIAEQMGERLARLARSVSIRERRDFSCAIFDADGRLVSNAPHVPVHLGAMGETVRDLLKRRADVLQPLSLIHISEPTRRS